MTRVAVCIITYRRPDVLKRLVDGLGKLAFDKCEHPNLEIIVVDNDPAGLACTFCEGISSDLGLPVRCFIEPRRGIPYARNTAIAHVDESVDFVAFIDDDEVPAPFWLDELLYVQQLYGADVVTGPALPHFTVPVAPWMIEGKFFGSPRYPTGRHLEWASTRNVLVRSEVFEEMDKLFDERRALSGGSDTHFFRRAHRLGYEIVWADEALIREWIPKSRANVRWILQRAFRYGNSYSLTKSELEPSVVVRAGLIVEASRIVVEGLSRLPRSVVFSRRDRLTFRWLRLVRALRLISRGAGIIAGVAGWRYEEYGRIHGV